MMKHFGDANSKLCRQIMENDELHEILRKEKFDLGLLQIMDACGAGLFKKIGLEKYILASAMPWPLSLAGIMGIPYSLSYVPGKNILVLCITKKWKFRSIRKFKVKYAIVKDGCTFSL